jgi:hypothetical protein
MPDPKKITLEIYTLPGREISRNIEHCFIFDTFFVTYHLEFDMFNELLVKESIYKRIAISRKSISAIDLSFAQLKQITDHRYSFWKINMYVMGVPDPIMIPFREKQAAMDVFNRLMEYWTLII